MFLIVILKCLSNYWILVQVGSNSIASVPPQQTLSLHMFSV